MEILIPLFAAAGAGVLSTIVNVYFNRHASKSTVMSEQAETIESLWRHTRALEEENISLKQKIGELELLAERLNARLGRLLIEMNSK